LRPIELDWTDRSAHKHRRIARNQSLGFAQSRNGRRAAVQPEREWNAASFLDQAIGGSTERCAALDSTTARHQLGMMLAEAETLSKRDDRSGSADSPRAGCSSGRAAAAGGPG
jgi:hypothetical protein